MERLIINLPNWQVLTMTADYHGIAPLMTGNLSGNKNNEFGNRE